MAIFKRSKTKKDSEAREENNAEVGAVAVGGLRGRNQIGLIKQSWITEKAGRMSPDRKYMFIVANQANKSEVKKSVEAAYGVKVQDVNMVVRKGKAKRLGRSLGRTSDYKKAIVTLQEGQKIEALTP